MPLAALLLAWPVAEVAVLILAGSWFGFWPVVAWLIATGLAGAWLVRAGGRQAALGLQDAFRGGPVPPRWAAGGAITVVAGVLLILPGLIGDTVGLMILLPPVQRMLTRRVTGTGFGVGNWGMAWRGGGAGRGDDGAIDGQYEVIAEKAVPGPDRASGDVSADHRH
jgi:UPF0716 protein FxsA